MTTEKGEEEARERVEVERARRGRVKRVAGVTVALDMQSPRTFRICHSVGTTRSRADGINSSGLKRLPRL